MADEPRGDEDARYGEGPSGTPMDRRQFLKAAGLAGAALGAASAFGGIAGVDARAAAPEARAAADVSGDCVAVLGLGAGPVFYPDRNNSGFALFHNGSAYLVDAGAGTPHQFMRLGVTLDRVKGLFFTHYHIDHTAGYADLLTRGSQMNGPDHDLKTLNAYGPSLPKAGGVNALDVLTNGIEAGFGPGYDLHFWARPYLDVPAAAPAPRPAVTTAVIRPTAGQARRHPRAHRRPRHQGRGARGRPRRGLRDLLRVPLHAPAGRAADGQERRLLRGPGALQRAARLQRGVSLLRGGRTRGRRDLRLLPRAAHQHAVPGGLQRLRRGRHRPVPRGGKERLRDPHRRPGLAGRVREGALLAPRRLPHRRRAGPGDRQGRQRRQAGAHPLRRLHAAPAQGGEGHHARGSEEGQRQGRGTRAGSSPRSRGT